MSDLIDRQVAIDALAEHEKSNGHNYTLFVDIVSECAEIIRDLPSVQPEQVEPCSVSLIEKREPIDGYRDRWYRKIFCCAKCGMKIRTETWNEKRCFWKGTILKDNSMPMYCPNCGKKMEG